MMINNEVKDLKFKIKKWPKKGHFFEFHKLESSQLSFLDV